MFEMTMAMTAMRDYLKIKYLICIYLGLFFEETDNINFFKYTYHIEDRMK